MRLVRKYLCLKCECKCKCKCQLLLHCHLPRFETDLRVPCAPGSNLTKHTYFSAPELIVSHSAFGLLSQSLLLITSWHSRLAPLHCAVGKSANTIVDSKCDYISTQLHSVVSFSLWGTLKISLILHAPARITETAPSLTIVVSSFPLFCITLLRCLHLVHFWSWRRSCLVNRLPSAGWILCIYILIDATSKAHRLAALSPGTQYERGRAMQREREIGREEGGQTARYAVSKNWSSMNKPKEHRLALTLNSVRRVFMSTRHVFDITHTPRGLRWRAISMVNQSVRGSFVYNFL